jgi:hypothetical protein
MTDWDDVEHFGHAVVLATSVGICVWLVVAGMAGWLT